MTCGHLLGIEWSIDGTAGMGSDEEREASTSEGRYPVIFT